MPYSITCNCGKKVIIKSYKGVCECGAVYTKPKFELERISKEKLYKDPDDKLTGIYDRI